MNAEDLAKCVGCKLPTAETWLPYIEEVFELYAINTPERQAAFLAQIGHESGGLKYLTEIWGPTTTQAHYEGRLDLGNVEAGDGKKFKGHGPIQITGRSNHAKVRDSLRERFPDKDIPDFEEEPTKLSEPEWGALSAGDYWESRGLNFLADAGDFKMITRKINGGLNGYEDRKRLWEIAKEVLA